jgi:hypothetical protein
MTYQNRTVFPYDVQHFGCYLFSICFHLDRRFGLGIFTDAGMLKIYNDEEADRDLGPESFVESPQHLCDHVCRNQVAFEDIHYPADHQTTGDELEVQEWINPATGSKHFMAAENGKVIYDPIEGGSIIGRVGHCESKRIFRVLTGAQGEQP